MSNITPFLNPFEWFRAYKYHKANAKFDKSQYDLELFLYSRILKNNMLHYGYFEDPDINPEDISLKMVEDAQENYANNIINQIKDEEHMILDVGCGYNQFKPRIPNLVGIDKFNNSADYMVDILEYNVEPSTYDAVIVFGSINFGEYSDIIERFRKVFDLTAPGGRVYVRANPGETHKNGPWVQIFPWDFEAAHLIAKECDVELVTFKKDNGNRLFFLFEKK